MGSNEQVMVIKDISKEIQKTVGVDKLREMLIHLVETQPSEVVDLPECKQIIKQYFTDTL